MRLIVTKDGVVKPELSPEQKKIKKLNKEVRELQKQVNFLLNYLKISQNDIDNLSTQQ